MEDKVIDLKKLKLIPQKTYLLEIYETKEYKWTYCNKKKKVHLIPEKSVIFNKKVIYEQLIKKKDLVYNE
jgi:hypothetical protein